MNGTSRLTRRTLGASILVFLAAACGRAEPLPVRVESLRENLPVLREAARAWRVDAYVADASISLLDDDGGGLLLDAGFQSPSEQSQSLLVRLMQDRTLDAEVVPHTVPVIQIEPIADDDWELDSTAALEIALNEEGVRYLEEHSAWSCSFLALERWGREPGSPVVWRLVLTDCLDPWTSQETIIDAMTGEVISRESHIGRPTLLVPTP